MSVVISGQWGSVNQTLATALFAGPGGATSGVLQRGGRGTSFDGSPNSLSRFAFLLLDEFTAITLSSAIEVLRAANYISDSDMYSWSVITQDGAPVVSSNGFVPDRITDYANGGNPQIVFVCGGTNVASHVDRKTISLLRRMARDGVILGGMGSGTYALAKAGLLDGYRCTIHWENLLGLQEAHRRVEFLEALFVIDRDRITCAGGIAPIDMMLSLVRARFGETLVAEISDQLVLDRVRSSRDRQRVPLAERVAIDNPVLARVAALMEENLENPLPANEIASSLDMSLRQLQRVFNGVLGTTLTEYYKRVRLRRGRELVRQSRMSITQIAVSCGFHSNGKFSREYRAYYGLTPRRERQLLAAAPQSRTSEEKQ